MNLADIANPGGSARNLVSAVFLVALVASATAVATAVLAPLARRRRSQPQAGDGA